MTAQLYPAQAVLPGHPDKLCDAIAEALVEEACRRDARAWCRIDVALQGQSVYLLGRLAGDQAADINVAEVVRSVCASTGLGLEWGMHLDQLRIVADLERGPLTERDLETRRTAESQHLAIGYAIDLPGINDFPAEQWLAARILRRLVQLREALPNLRLGPSGQVLLVLEEAEFPVRLAGCSITLIQAADGSPVALEKTIHNVLGDEMSHLSRRLPGFDARLPDAFALNITSASAEGPSPAAEKTAAAVFLAAGNRALTIAGQSGRRTVMDSYGLRTPDGGTVLCGRDFYQPERAGAILARRLARAIVRTGVAHQCQAMLAFAPGQVEAQILSLHGDGKVLDASRWATLLDRSLAGVGQRYTGQVLSGDIARYGHFSSGDRPWEKLHFDE